MPPGLITFNVLSKLHLTGPPRNIENTLNILHVPQLVTLDLHLKSEDGENLTDFRPITESFLTSNGQYLKDGLRSLCLESGFAQLSMAHHLTPFKIFTKLDTLPVRVWNYQFFPTSSLANFFHENKAWSNLRVLCISHFAEAHRNLGDELSIAAPPLLADSFPNLLCLSIVFNDSDQEAIEAIATDNMQGVWPGGTRYRQLSPLCRSFTDYSRS